MFSHFKTVLIFLFFILGFVFLSISENLSILSFLSFIIGAYFAYDLTKYYSLDHIKINNTNPSKTYFIDKTTSYKYLRFGVLVMYLGFVLGGIDILFKISNTELTSLRIAYLLLIICGLYFVLFSTSGQYTYNLSADESPNELSNEEIQFFTQMVKKKKIKNFQYNSDFLSLELPRIPVIFWGVITLMVFFLIASFNYLSGVPKLIAVIFFIFSLIVFLRPVILNFNSKHKAIIFETRTQTLTIPNSNKIYVILQPLVINFLDIKSIHFNSYLEEANSRHTHTQMSFNYNITIKLKHSNDILLYEEIFSKSDADAKRFVYIFAQIISFMTKSELKIMDTEIHYR